MTDPSKNFLEKISVACYDLRVTNFFCAGLGALSALTAMLGLEMKIEARQRRAKGERFIAYIVLTGAALLFVAALLLPTR